MNSVIRASALGPVLLVAACGEDYSLSSEPPVIVSDAADAGGGPSAEGAGEGGASPVDLPDCTAQRTVHLVGGNGGLAWFTLVWPVPEVVTSAVSTYAFDDPAKAGYVAGTSKEHPLLARKLGARLVWDGVGSHAGPSIFVAGSNQTHTTTPTSTRAFADVDVIASGAVLQAKLSAPLPVLAFRTGLYGAAPKAPPATVVASVELAIAALRGVITLSAAVEQDLRPSQKKLDAWVDPKAYEPLRDLAQILLFTANAFRLGFVSTVVLPAMNDDPHSAFADAAAIAATTQRADALAKILDSFYAELAASFETTCALRGKRLSLADNTVLVVSGDTHKNPFQGAGWPDGTPGGSNLLYLRSNGHVKPGWFGRLVPDMTGGRTNFDPVTGLATASATSAESTSAAQLGILFAIARGDAAAVAAVSAHPYKGVTEPKLP